MAEMETKTEAAVEQEAHTAQDTKFCKHCGNRIAAAAVVCPQCGCQVEEIKSAETPQINMAGGSYNAALQPEPLLRIKGVQSKEKNGWREAPVSHFLCFNLPGSSEPYPPSHRWCRGLGIR